MVCDMCDWGDEVRLRVPIPAEDSHTGKLRWANKPVDSCLADIVRALNEGGIYTRQSCCGHGECEGAILLHDGRELVIGPAVDWEAVGRRVTETALAELVGVVRVACRRCDDTGVAENGYTCRSCTQPGRYAPSPSCEECMGTGMELEECDCVSKPIIP